MNRLVELLLEGTWVAYQLENLEVDDVFRMFEPDGKPVSDGQMWIVLNNPFPVHDSWEVECEPVKGVTDET